MSSDVTYLLGFPKDVMKMIPGSKSKEKKGTFICADIFDAPTKWIYYMDVPGFSKSQIQVTVEDGNTLVVESDRKRKRQNEDEEEGGKYVKLERRMSSKPLLRKFLLPEDANVSAVAAKCENGELVVTVDKIAPRKPKSVLVTID